MPHKLALEHGLALWWVSLTEFVLAKFLLTEFWVILPGLEKRQVLSRETTENKIHEAYN